MKAIAAAAAAATAGRSIGGRQKHWQQAVASAERGGGRQMTMAAVAGSGEALTHSTAGWSSPDAAGSSYDASPDAAGSSYDASPDADSDSSTSRWHPVAVAGEQTVSSCALERTCAEVSQSQSKAHCCSPSHLDCAAWLLTHPKPVVAGSPAAQHSCGLMLSACACPRCLPQHHAHISADVHNQLISSPA